MLRSERARVTGSGQRATHLAPAHCHSCAPHVLGAITAALYTHVLVAITAALFCRLLR